ncbi:dehydrogenase/reductase sdr family member 7-related [Holotrichia oblita]|uniref:Dehydrogenase/reductase sdr family member 7-related n=1 Tax=Holotrichia oblita TaxID=644536 RepID=A0ACB9TXY8_HOLOL|nr:dehydrogenase/reductase sdr family member 7-related [Holotrichia oblita]
MILALIGAFFLIYILFYAILTYILDCDIQLAFYEKFGKSIDKLKGKVVFITGASSGIGENVALILAKHGVKLILAARRENELERVKKNCLEISDGKLSNDDILVLPMDVTDISSHQKHFETASKHFGRIHILFNNAGRSQRAMWEDIDLSIDKQMFELNVFSVLNLTRIAIKHFKANGGGHIVVTSSVTGIVAFPFSASYDGSKHALHGYFNALRTEKLKHNIKVSILCPGPAFTNFLAECFTDKPGEKYGLTTKPTDKRLTGYRCGELCAIAIANELNEAWMGCPPLISFLFLSVYFPNLFNWFVISMKNYYVNLN